MTFAASHQDFAVAWNDLRDRLGRGIDTLRARHRAAGTADAPRLAGKLAGLEDALALYECLHEQTAVSGDFAGAWRMFTDAAYAAYTSAGLTDAHRQGLALALEYQRGYTPEIDAPPLPALAARGLI